MDRLPLDLAEVVSEPRNGLEELYGTRVRDLLLYGSYARGNQREGGDVELLVLLDGPVETGREILRLESYLLGHQGGCDRQSGRL